MKHKQTQHCGSETFPGETNQQGRDCQCPRPTVQQHVMVLLVVLECVLLAGNQRPNNISGDYKAVSIGKNARESHQLAVAWIVSRDRRDESASDQVG